VAICLLLGFWVAILLPSQSRPPTGFAYEALTSFSDTRLDFIGALDDDEKNSRLWMLNIEGGANDSLGKDCIKRWLLLDEMPSKWPEFSLLIDVETSAAIAVEAHRLVASGNYRHEPLTLQSSNRSQGMHNFDVPATLTGDRLLVFVAMKPAAWNAISRDPKFRIKSGPPQHAGRE
jgi:hypothetical protein